MINLNTDNLPDLFEPLDERADIFKNIWALLLIMALVLFFLELIVSYLILPTGFFNKLLSGIKQLKSGDDFSYDKLSMMIKQKKREMIPGKQDLSHLFRRAETDKDFAARLYLAKKNSNKKK